MKQFVVYVDFHVSKGIEVSAESAEQAEQLVKAKCDENPYQYCINPDSCLGHEVTEVSECEEDDNPTDLQKAIQYVKDNMDEDDMAILKAEMNLCWKSHIVPDEDTVECGKVIDLLEEYGQDNDLPEGWWMSEAEMADILCEL